MFVAMVFIMALNALAALDAFGCKRYLQGSFNAIVFILMLLTLLDKKL